jgi:RES domain-containing protein
MRLWRITRFPGLDGAGGILASARWHSRPRPVIYAAEHPALAMAEVLVHMRLDVSAIPLTLRLVAIDIEKGAKRSKPPEVPSGWQANHSATQALGNTWLDARSSLLMPVPSALIAHSTNWLINPLHPQGSTHLSEVDLGPFWIDPRFF